ncbi:nitrilase [Puccinia graminis f. sp. tritici CRL 75-36-700-3]|uniref:Nitrilase n=1 Tax=Puccinia graminis f. sp. tritici (strain CRL 75-36-700-3 / race SCCL) TaxID=418459 RepID=E3JSX7_PUCGT|nr:nitrilase [Puccinia graminis f. sp. tritici CRL 75-36-700-3]EFP75152.1 nitrilase [Puccinia graminis f. sp. tritici CRL 75-36-700-3]
MLCRITLGLSRSNPTIRLMSTFNSNLNVQGTSFNIALIQLGGIGADKPANLTKARAKIADAVRGNDPARKPQVVVLPEIFNSPYGSGYFDKYAEVIGWHESKGADWDVNKCESPSIKMLSSAAKEEQVWLFGGSIPERSPHDPKILYNSAPVFQPDGKLVALHRKLHLFDIDIPNKITFKESETLSAGQDPVTIVETPFGKIGLGICYDIRFPEMAMIAARRGCIAMIYPGAFNLTTGPLHWELLQRARAVDNLIYVSACSPARNPSSEYQAWGHSSIVDPMGLVKATCDETESIIHGRIDIDELIAARKGLPVTTQRRFDVYPDVSKPL